jgi:hypothetical protein
VGGLELVVGFLIAWAARKARRVGERVDAEADRLLDVGLDRLHDVVVGKLGGDTALARLESEASEAGEASTRTKARVRLALEDVVEDDPDFAAQVQEALTQVQAVAGAHATAHGIAIGGDVRADTGGIAIGGVTGGRVSIGDRPDPPEPVRS